MLKCSRARRFSSATSVMGNPTSSRTGPIGVVTRVPTPTPTLKDSENSERHDEERHQSKDHAPERQNPVDEPKRSILKTLHTTRQISGRSHVVSSGVV